MSMIKFLFSILTLLLIASASQIRFQLLNKTIGYPTLQYYGKIGDSISIKLQLSKAIPFEMALHKQPGLNKFLQARQSDSNIVDWISPTAATYTYQHNVLQNSMYVAFFQNYQPNEVVFIKISLIINRVVISVQYQTLTNYFYDTTFGWSVKPVYQFKTTSICKAKVYWQGPSTAMKIFSPGIDPLSGTPFLSISSGTNVFEINVSAAGTWSIRIQANYFFWSNHKRGIMNITTFTQNQCLNYCTQKPYPVVGLSQGTTNICSCDQKRGSLLWDPINQICISPICNNDNIKEDLQVCDNEGRQGCKVGCSFDAGFICSGSNGFPSVCTTTCGDGVKAGIQQCDNRKQAGCRQCIVQPNYTCVQDVNLLSRCKDNVCGDSFKSNVEECDNGNKTGCINCKITSGYQCSGLLGEQSSCSSACGDGVKTETEQCDAGDDEGCKDCRIEVGYVCQHNLYSKSLCYTVCGDGILAGSEVCDNKNQTGCENCKPSLGFTCEGERGGTSTCQVKCGDSMKAATEKCDNGNREGCSAGCIPDKGYICSGEDGRSSLCLPACGDGIRIGNQACDNGKKTGCLSCTSFDRGYTCTGEIGSKSVCTAICGDSIRTASEQCDNGNQPGCSKNCIVEQGYTCSGGLGAVSDCRTICGDRILAGTEQCDNGKKEGCTNCIVETGYVCKLTSNRKTSVCNKN